MPKYESSCLPKYCNKGLSSKQRYTIFIDEKSHLLLGETNPNHRAFIFALYEKKYELIKQDLEANSRIENFDDTDIDNVFLQDLKNYKANGEFDKLVAGYVNYKIEKQCESEGREPFPKKPTFR